jgi:hypothetical protein
MMIFTRPVEHAFDATVQRSLTPIRANIVGRHVCQRFSARQRDRIEKPLIPRHEITPERPADRGLFRLHVFFEEDQTQFSGFLFHRSHMAAERFCDFIRAYFFLGQHS